MTIFLNTITVIRNDAFFEFEWRRLRDAMREGKDQASAHKTPKVVERHHPLTFSTAPNNTYYSGPFRAPP
jgi:hypothetical protein